MFDDVTALLVAHGLTGSDEQSFSHAGFSGATLTRLVRGDAGAFVLKRMSMERDWIMRATDDVACREAAFADASIDLRERVRTPAIGAARDGDGYALLLHDVTDDLLPQGVVTESQLDVILTGTASLHAQPAPMRLPRGAI